METHQQIINMIFLFSYLFFEILAASSGSYYIIKNREDKLSRYFVYFLWLTFFIELFGTIPSLIYYFDLFPYLKGTFLQRNHWLFNIFFIFNFSFYLYYFIRNYSSQIFKRIMKVILIIYVFTSILNLILTDIYFTAVSSYTYILGTILIFIGAIIYLFETIQSDKVLAFYRTLPFYIAVGSMIFHLVVTPLFIYGQYYNVDKSPDFVTVRKIILNSAIMILYILYSIGFIVCAREEDIIDKIKKDN
ncbi:hypothetical protein [Aquimarina rhabdastrellae]